MALLKIEYYSEVLGMNRQMNVIYPEASKTGIQNAKDIPVLYLLHGMSNNENSWLNRSAIERMIRKTNLAIVMPSTDLGWYTNTKYGMNYFDAIAIELPKVIANFFPNLSTKREKTFIAGLSMGGYGAFKLALATGNYSYAASLSGALDFEHVDLAGANPQSAYWAGIFGSLEEFQISDNSLLNLAKKADYKPQLYAWCGKQDALIRGNDFAMTEFSQLGFKTIYETTDGTHDWYYWSKYIERILDWLPIDYQKEERLS